MVAARKQLEESAPRKLWRVWQNKYVLDKQPLWKRCFFWGVYMPIAWFAYFVVKLPICNRVDENGQLGWEEDQGIFSSEEKAREVCAGRKFWFAKSMDEDVCAPEETCQAGKHISPGSPVAGLYEQRQLDCVSVPQHAIRVLEKANIRAREAERT